MNAINRKMHSTPPDTDRPDLTPERIIGHHMPMLVAHVKAWKSGQQEKINAENRKIAAKLIDALGRNAWAIIGVDEAGNLTFMRRFKSVVHMAVHESPKSEYYQRKGREVMKNRGWMDGFVEG